MSDRWGILHNREVPGDRSNATSRGLKMILALSIAIAAVGAAPIVSASHTKYCSAKADVPWDPSWAPVRVLALILVFWQVPDGESCNAEPIDSVCYATFYGEVEGTVDGGSYEYMFAWDKNGDDGRSTVSHGVLPNPYQQNPYYQPYEKSSVRFWHTSSVDMYTSVSSLARNDHRAWASIGFLECETNAEDNAVLDYGPTGNPGILPNLAPPGANPREPGSPGYSR